MLEEGIAIERRHWIYRHALTTRVTHWINAFCLVILLLSGLQIVNAHPALYLGMTSAFEAPSLVMKATPQRISPPAPRWDRRFSDAAVRG